MKFLLPYLNEAFILSSAGFVIYGWYLIRHQQVEKHRKVMLTAATLGSLFFITYVVKTLFYGDTAFGGPLKYQLPYLTFLQIHTTLATVAAILGIITIRRALRARFKEHRRIAPWTASAWLITAASGLMVFLLLYIVFPPGPTSQNLIKLLGL